MKPIDYENKLYITKDGKVTIVGNCAEAVAEAVPSVSEDFHIQFWEDMTRSGEKFVLTGWGRTTA